MCVHSCTHRFFLSKGRGLSREECEREGHAAVYLAYLHEVLAIHVTPERERERKKEEREAQADADTRTQTQTNRQTDTHANHHSCLCCVQIRKTCRQHGRTMMFWADMLHDYESGIMHALPSDVIAMEWGYEDDHPFDERCEQMAEAGVPFYVCPGTSSWNSVVCVHLCASVCMCMLVCSLLSGSWRGVWPTGFVVVQISFNLYLVFPNRC